MRPLVYIVVLNYNNLEDTVECITSLKSIDYENYRILLVDNGSDYDVFVNIKRTFPEIEYLRLNENVGYAGGNNAGIRKVLDKADYIFVINNDVVVEKDVLKKMVEEMEKDNRIAACQPIVMYYHNKKIWSAGTQMFLGYPRLYLKNKICKIENCFEPPYGLVGCAILIRTSALKDLGGFDESLFMTNEETDWCIRAKKKGYSFLVVNAKVYHKVSSTIGFFSPMYLYYISRNWILIAKKNFSSLMYAYVVLTEFLRIVYYIYLLTKMNKLGLIKYYLKGVMDGLRGVKGRVI